MTPSRTITALFRQTTPSPCLRYGALSLIQLCNFVLSISSVRAACRHASCLLTPGVPCFIVCFDSVSRASRHILTSPLLWPTRTLPALRAHYPAMAYSYKLLVGRTLRSSRSDSHLDRPPRPLPAFPSPPPQGRNVKVGRPPLACPRPRLAPTLRPTQYFITVRVSCTYSSVLSVVDKLMCGMVL